MAAVPDQPDERGVLPPDAVDLAAAAERLGVHYQTAYRWVREGRLPAVRVRGRYRLAPGDVAAFAAARDQPQPLGPPPGRRSWDLLANRFHAALGAGDERTAAELVLRLHAQQEPLVELLERIVVPALRRIGAGWADGTLTVADEHRASAIVERILASLDRRRAGRPRGTAVAAAPAGEEHGLPVAMAAATLREDGWSVEHLGRDLPLDALADFCSRHRPHLVVLTVTTPAVHQAAVAARDHLAAAGHSVLVGGPGRTLVELVHEARAARADQRRAQRDRPEVGGA